MTCTLTTMKMINNLLHLRPARATDREPTVAWCNTLWNNTEDYIGYVWDDWLAQGNLFVATLPGHDVPVGLLRMRQLSPSEAWFGGLRIHPDLHGRGGGRQLINAALEWARQHGATCLGYMTETANQRMHYLGAALGFVRIGGFEWHALPRYEAEAVNVHHDPARITLAHAANLASQQGRYFSGWAVQRLTAERLQHHAAAGELLVNQAGTAWMIHEMQAPNLVYIAHAEGGEDELRLLLAQAFRQSPEIAVHSPLWHKTPAFAQRHRLGYLPINEQYSVFQRTI